MGWLKDHVYIAAWLSPLLALVALIIQDARGQGNTNPSRFMIYVGFLTFLAAVFTPALEVEARVFAGAGVIASFFFLFMDASK
jgi:hypothetical protein